MDTSPEYIKMCDCEEIQDGHAWSRGDFYAEDIRWIYARKFKKPRYQIENIDGGSEYNETDVWLPRQDQLQEMLGKYLWQLNFDFIRWLCDEPYDGHIRHEHLDFKSMEQLWLAFVMKEKFGKVWDGEWH